MGVADIDGELGDVFQCVINRGSYTAKRNDGFDVTCQSVGNQNMCL